jgi:hypothetical protein
MTSKQLPMTAALPSLASTTSPHVVPEPMATEAVNEKHAHVPPLMALMVSAAFHGTIWQGLVVQL